jgi:cytochrome c oxidase subunit 2
MDIGQRKDLNQTVRPSVPLTLIFFALTIVGGILIALLRPIILPPQASLQAQRTDDLFTILLLIGGFVFCLVQGLLLYSVIRFRARANDTSDGVPFHGNTMLEIVWTVIPAVVVAVLAVLSYGVWADNNAPKDAINFVNGKPITIQAYGARYAWSFEYMIDEEMVNSKGETIKPVLKSNLLHIYVGQHVKVDMDAKDVIHSFWVPAMRVKQDLIPGRTTEVRFDPIATDEGFPYRRDENGNMVTLSVEDAKLTAEQAREKGVGDRFIIYPLRCTELCGSGHGNMITDVYLYEDEQSYLANFYEPSLQRVIVVPDDPTQQGLAVLQSGAYPCANCHVMDSLGWAGVVGPSLNGIGNRADRRRGGVNAVEYLVQSIHLPNEYLVPGYAQGQMPYFGPSAEAPAGHAPYNVMPQDDLLGIVAYLCTQTESGNPTDTACGFAVNDDGSSVDPENTKALIQPILDSYDSLYGE